MSFEKLNKIINSRKQFEKINLFYPFNTYLLIFAFPQRNKINANEIGVALEHNGFLSCYFMDPQDSKTIRTVSIEKDAIYKQLGTKYEQFLSVFNEKNAKSLSDFREDILSILSKKYFNPYFEYSTDLNFCDIHGKSLLHYAAEQGLFEEVKKLVSNGANVNLPTIDWIEDQKTAIMFALESGHLDIAKYLYEKNANCSQLSLAKISDPECHIWLLNLIKLELFNSCEILEIDGVHKLSISTKLSNKTKFFYWNEFDGDDKITDRMVEINDLNYLRCYTETYTFIPELEGKSALICAAANNRLEIIKFLLDEILVPVNTKPYTTSGLQAAINADQIAIVKYLVSRGADVNFQDKNKHNAIMTAVKCKNRDIVEYLLQQSLDLDQTDVHGNHITYFATEAGNVEILKMLLDNPQLKAQLTKENIYGHSAIDIAVFKNQSEILALLPSIPKKTFPIGSSLDIQIDHHNLIKKMHYYLRLCYFSTEHFPIRGKCAGFSYLHNHNQNQSDIFFNTLVTLSSWQGDEKILYQPFLPNQLMAKYYQNLSDFFYQKINDVAWFQHQNELLKGFPIYDQDDRKNQYALVGTEEGKAPYLIAKFFGDLNIKQIEEILYFFEKMPAETQLFLGGARHITCAYKNEKNEIFYYDPRFSYRAKAIYNVSNLLKLIIDFKYINIGLHSSNEKFEIKIEFYTALKNLCNFNKNFHVFSKEGYEPLIVQQFQFKSPNQFTALHVAVLMKSLASLEKLLSDGHIDINAKDGFGQTSLDLAITFNFKEAIDLLLFQPSINLENKTIAKLFESYRRFFDSNSTWLDYLSYAIQINNLSLIKALIKYVKKEGVNLNEINTNSKTVLSLAIQFNLEESVKELVNNGANWLTSGDDFTPMCLVIKQYEHYYSLMINSLKCIDQKDQYKNSAIHYAAKFGKIDFLKDLLDRSANVSLEDSHKRTPLTLILENQDIFSEEKFISLVKIITGHKSFDFSVEQFENFYQITKYGINKNIGLLFDPNMQSISTGDYFLHYIIKNDVSDKKQFIEILLKNGANFEFKNKAGKTAYELAYEHGDIEILGLFNQYKVAFFRPFFSASLEISNNQVSHSPVVSPEL